MILGGGARQRLEKITPLGMTAIVHLSLTDEPPMAQAIVIISALMKQPNRSEA